ncbi:MAG: HAD-IA family hydrolase [Woeseia sp.]
MTATPGAALPRLLLLDFGGVLLHLNDPVETFGFGRSRDDFNKLWLMSPAVRAHETGEIGPEEFAERMVADLQLSYSPREFIRRFDSWPAGVSAATNAVLQSVPAIIECAILSNTNALHWHKQDIARDLGGRIGRAYLSFETGHIKPDAQAFLHVLSETGYDASDVLFLDDNPLNIAAGSARGIRSRLCPGVDALRSVLAAEGIIQP